MNDINPAPIDIESPTRMSPANASKRPEPPAAAPAKPMAAGWRFSFWTRGWIPGGWDGPF
ncbi:MAG TPA: hypothetical protein VH835_11665 [Dongiaceae bacterium]